MKYKIIVTLHTGSHIHGTVNKLMMKSKIFSLMFKAISNTAILSYVMLPITAHLRPMKKVAPNTN